MAVTSIIGRVSRQLRRIRPNLRCRTQDRNKMKRVASQVCPNTPYDWYRCRLTDREGGSADLSAITPWAAFQVRYCGPRSSQWLICRDRRRLLRSLTSQVRHQARRKHCTFPSPNKPDRRAQPSIPDPRTHALFSEPEARQRSGRVPSLSTGALRSECELQGRQPTCQCRTCSASSCSSVCRGSRPRPAPGSPHSSSSAAPPSPS